MDYNIVVYSSDNLTPRLGMSFVNLVPEGSNGTSIMIKNSELDPLKNYELEFQVCTGELGKTSVEYMSRSGTVSNTIDFDFGDRNFHKKIPIEVLEQVPFSKILVSKRYSDQSVMFKVKIIEKSALNLRSIFLPLEVKQGDKILYEIDSSTTSKKIEFFENTNQAKIKQLCGVDDRMMQKYLNGKFIFRPRVQVDKTLEKMLNQSYTSFEPFQEKERVFFNGLRRMEGDVFFYYKVYGEGEVRGVSNIRTFKVGGEALAERYLGVAGLLIALSIIVGVLIYLVVPTNQKNTNGEGAKTGGQFSGELGQIEVADSDQDTEEGEHDTAEMY